MKLRTLLAPLMLLSASSAFATPVIYIQEYVGSVSGSNLSLRFEADDTVPTAINTLIMGSNFNGHDISAIPHHTTFTPSTLSDSYSRGWDSFGVRFVDLETGTRYRLYALGINEPFPGIYNFDTAETEYALYTIIPSSVDEPAVFGLLAMASLATVVSRLKRQHLA